MRIKLSSFHSYLHESLEFDQENQDFLEEIEKRINARIELAPLDDYDCTIKLIFVESGGSEGLFLANKDKLKEPYYLLTKGTNNSLAASMEIMTYLNLHDLKGEILHGDIQYIADRIIELERNDRAKKELSQTVLGVLGTPSDWLISSIPDYDAVKEKFGITLKDIPLTVAENAYQEEKDDSLLDENDFDQAELHKALRLYHALDKVRAENSLNGFTIRCFDLIFSLHTTGCMSLSYFNQYGYIGTCEGDIMAMISMQIVRTLFGQSSFQCNPSMINTRNNTIVFAHCAVPFDMLDSYALDSHFESKTAVAVKGELKKTDITVFRISSSLKDYFVEEGVIIDNLHEKNLCRTQILVRLDCDVSQLLKKPCGNHHIVFYGRHKKEIESFLASL